MKNVYLLATDKPSRLFNCFGKLEIGDYVTTRENLQVINQHIYITNNEEDKIILTTEQSLIEKGVQAIDDEFLEWFIKNPNCEEVVVKTRYLHYYKTGETFISFSKTPEFSSRNMQCIKIEPRYEIIIPIVEPKQETHICKYCKAETSQSDDECYAKPKQETLEEDDLKIPSKFCIPHKHYISDDDKICYETGYKDGIKWQMDKQSDFIIGFLEFIEGTYSYSNIYDHWYLHADTSKTYSKKQLLEVYLKRNKL